MSGRTWILWVVKSALDDFCDMVGFPWTETRGLVSVDRQCGDGKLPIQDFWELGSTTLTSQPAGESAKIERLNGVQLTEGCQMTRQSVNVGAVNSWRAIVVLWL